MIADTQRLSRDFRPAPVSWLPPSGGRLAQFQVIPLTSGDGTCIISVEDDGPGIPNAHLQRVFDWFFSYRPADDRREHVGLGLAIAKQIVESYVGTIAASNRPDGGVRFEVRMPVIPVRPTEVISA